jgi:hypothetical protein
MNGIPLKKEDLRGEFEETVVQTILRQTGELQKAVYNVGGLSAFSLNFFNFLFPVLRLEDHVVFMHTVF